MGYVINSVGQRIYVKRLAENEVRGILMADKYKKTWMVGKVIHRGPECQWVEEGDVILFAKYSGVEIPVDMVYVDERYGDTLVMNEPDILAILEKEDAENAPVETPQIQEAVNG